MFFENNARPVEPGDGAVSGRGLMAFKGPMDGYGDGQKRLIECHDLPPGETFAFLMNHPTADVTGRVARRVDENGDVWTWPDKAGTFGFRVEIWT